MFEWLKNRKNLSLQNLTMNAKLIILYFAVFFVPMFFTLFFLYIKLNTTLSSWETIQAEQNLVQVENHFLGITTNIKELSDRLYVNETLLRIINTDYEDRLLVYDDYNSLAFLDDYLISYKDVRNIRFYIDNQSLLSNSYFVITNEDIKKEQWFINAIQAKGKILWIVKQDEIRAKKYLSLVRSVWDVRTNTYSGVLSINLDNDKINSYLAGQQYETLICANNTIIYSEDESLFLSHIDFLENIPIHSKKEIIKNVNWRNEKHTAFIKSIPVSKDNSFDLLYLIPRNHLVSTTKQVLLFSVIIFGIGFFFSIIFIVIISRYISKRVYLIRNVLNKVVQNNFEIQESIGGTDEFAEIYNAIYEMTYNIKTLINEVYKRKVEQEQLISRQNEIRFKMLSNQINPHFLFNTLETIRMKSLVNDDREVALTIKLLANILRHNLKVLDHEVPLLSELNVISNYLDIQQIRFKDRVSYDIVCLNDVRNVYVLPLLIQPIVENSFIHGLESKVQGGFILITISTEIVDAKEVVCIEVKDNGNGIAPKKLKEILLKLNRETDLIEDEKSSIGLVNVHQRVKLYYGQAYGLHIQSIEGQETIITIRLPLVIKSHV